MQIAVLAAGAWGTALAISLAGQHRVALWARDAAQAAAMARSRSNARYLPGTMFPPNLRVVEDFVQAVTGAELAIIATPLAGLRETARQVQAVAPGVPVVWLCKGLEVATGQLPHSIAADELDADTPRGVLSGPSFAQEVAAGLPTALTLASRDHDFAQRTALALHHPRLRIYSSDDVLGVEIGAAVKNVMAIAAGVCDGMNLGLNARAALITRGLAEITRLGVTLGARAVTFMGLAGLGDLVLTCTGDLSRNRRVGLALAEGRKLPEILASLGHVAEGVPAAREVCRLAERSGVEMPITCAVARMLFEGQAPGLAVEELMGRDPKDERLG